jgi:hypothetical protein
MARPKTSRSTPLGWAGLIALLLPFLPTALLAETSAPPDTVPALGGPIRVELRDGRSQSGQPLSFRDDILMIRTFLDGGAVDQGFPRAHIAQLHFPGDDVVAHAMEWQQAGDLVRALPYLEAIWRQRAPFLQLLPPETTDLLGVLPAAHLETGDPYRAIGLARTLLPHASGEEARNRLHEVILLGHYELEFYQETEELARAWIEGQSDFPRSALGWRILGDLALRADDLAQVRWRVLQPIALAGPEPMAHLAHCYALAIHAFHHQDGESTAAQLHREMMDRHLSWPDAPALAATGEWYETRALREARQRAARAEPDLDLRPPENDLNLPIRKVRKLLPTHSP